MQSKEDWVKLLVLNNFLMVAILEQICLPQGTFEIFNPAGLMIIDGIVGKR